MMEKLAAVGRKGHDFDYFRSLLRERGVEINHGRGEENIRELFLAVQSWSVGMRYEPNELVAEEARPFLRAAERLVVWAKRS